MTAVFWFWVVHATTAMEERCHDFSGERSDHGMTRPELEIAIALAGDSAKGWTILSCKCCNHGGGKMPRTHWWRFSSFIFLLFFEESNCIWVLDENEKGRKINREKKLRFREIRINLASPPRRSLSHSAHHHAEIQHKVNTCNAEFKFSNQLKW